MHRAFAAPWATSLKVVSILSTLLMMGFAWMLPLPEQAAPLLVVSLRVFPVLLLGICALFTVRRYEVTGTSLNVQRLLWVTRIPLRTLTEADWRRGSFGWCWRTCGNGGLYSFTGWYYQRPLGSFRALATRMTDVVILKFSDRKPIVVTPDDPHGFVEAIKTKSAI